jgi:hypothetical protein
MQSARHLRHVLEWNLRGKPLPPPAVVKQRTVKHYQKTFGPKIFIETGTYLGDMVAAVAARFTETYSIELSPELCERAQTRFATRKNVHILEGDSSEVLPLILKNISEPCLFWLDGHFSGGITAQGKLDYPILQELEHIRRHSIKNHLILIDDARLFVSPAPALEHIVECLRSINPAYVIENRDDIIRAFTV